MISDDGYARRAADRLLRSRTRLLLDHGFFGLLLMHMHFALDDTFGMAATDGDFIYFSPEFLANISDEELDFIMMHEVMHTALAHTSRVSERDSFAFNVACDIVVNSIIIKEMGRGSFSLEKYGPAMHLAPSGREGYLYSAEEVYEMLGKYKLQCDQASDGAGGGTAKGKGAASGRREANGRGTASGRRETNDRGEILDDHSRWGKHAGDDRHQATWRQRILAAAKAMERRERDCGRLPLFAERLVRELAESKVDWRSVLQNFIQEEVFDYGFQPPDKRYQDGDFLLPDFNDKRNVLHNVMFYVDASGSVSNQELVEAMSEVVGAVEQFGGCLTGYVSFFDAKVGKPLPFDDVSDLNRAAVCGGGGTSFQTVFDSLQGFAKDNPVSCAIVLTDGYAPYPAESAAADIPILWLINNEKKTPPWGLVVRMD
ncbi:MAG: VWA-like domain-containing protein [Coriobacteriales bacterium]|jgi:predicted metal-dependent peptidase|nr:VWA-like domain-containing protein [Coriobacteriales bacterium]